MHAHAATSTPQAKVTSPLARQTAQNPSHASRAVTTRWFLIQNYIQNGGWDPVISSQYVCFLYPLCIFLSHFFSVTCTESHLFVRTRQAVVLPPIGPKQGVQETTVHPARPSGGGAAPFYIRKINERVVSSQDPPLCHYS